MVVKIINKKKSIQHFLNEDIPFPEIFLLDNEGEKIGVVSKQEALIRAKDVNLDLFCISPNANPPVCRIGDYQKHSYQLKKKSKASNKKNSCKEITISFGISENDSRVKLRKIENWLNDGNEVKVSLMMRGREQNYKDLALKKCETIISYLQSKSEKIQLKKDIQLVKNIYHFLLFGRK